MTLRSNRWYAGMLGLAAVVASAQPLSEVVDDIQHSHIDTSEYQSCVVSLPQYIPLREQPVGRTLVDAVFADHPQQDLLTSWIGVESSYDPLAVSEAGASGLGQLMPRTAQGLGLRVASADELACLTEKNGSYVSLLRSARDAVREGTLPYEVLAAVHEPFDAHKNLRASFQYLQEMGLGRDDDRLVFMKYHAGPSLTNVGSRTRSYPDKIFNYAQQ